MRAIIFLLIIVLIFVVVRFALQRINEMREEAATEEAQPEEASMPKQMVQCQTCGVHIPKEDAFLVLEDETEDQADPIDLAYVCDKHRV